MGERFRNPYVIRHEAGHPGFRKITVLATPSDLAKLGKCLIQDTERYDTLFDEFASFEHGQSSRVNLSFVSCTDDEIDKLHTVTWKHKSRGWIRGVFFVILLVFAGIGIYSIIV